MDKGFPVNYTARRHAKQVDSFRITIGIEKQIILHLENLQKTVQPGKREEHSKQTKKRQRNVKQSNHL